MVPDAALVERFAADLDALIAPEATLGVAVSGGPDSLALLLLAAAARTGRMAAATVDHALRPQAGSEAEEVAALCRRLSVPHSTLQVRWSEPPAANVQAEARAARYAELGHWAAAEGLAAVATAHHADDQAETLLMRLARGSGVGGLAGIQSARALDGGALLIRPLLGWRRTELHAIVGAAGLKPADDPSNRDERFDRTRARALLSATGWLDPRRLAAAASNCGDADRALEWVAEREFSTRHRREGDAVLLDPRGLPAELRRRLLLQAFALLGASEPAGPQLSQAMAVLEAGGTTTLAGLKLEGGEPWRLRAAPPRRG